MGDKAKYNDDSIARRRVSHAEKISDLNKIFSGGAWEPHVPMEAKGIKFCVECGAHEWNGVALGSKPCKRELSCRISNTVWALIQGNPKPTPVGKTEENGQRAEAKLTR